MRPREHAGEHAVHHLAVTDDDATDLFAQHADALAKVFDFVSCAFDVSHVASSVSGPDQLEIPAPVETIAGGNGVVFERLFGHALVLVEDVLVPLADAAALGRAVPALGRGGSVAGVRA